MDAVTLTSVTYFDFARLVIRPLTANDSDAYRELRSYILKLGEGKYFSNSYMREKQFTTEQHWHEWCTECQEHCTIGTFIDGELIGIMSIAKYGAKEGLTAEWESVWLDPQYRQQGFAKLAYEKVQQWTMGHGYEFVVSFIRADNKRALAIRGKNGATYFYTKRNETWADGSIADAYCFMLNFTGQDDVSERALRYLDEAHTLIMEDNVEVDNLGIFKKLGG